MDINESFGIPLFPGDSGGALRVTGEFLDSIRRRGFEVVVHDLNHDGRLFSDKKEFMKRVARINAYGKEFGATGFRAAFSIAISGGLTRWISSTTLRFQRRAPGPAARRMLYGHALFRWQNARTAVTMTQDYTLFHILNDYSTELWKRQTSLIMEKHGLMNVIIHPDYITGSGRESV